MGGVLPRTNFRTCRIETHKVSARAQSAIFSNFINKQGMRKKVGRNQHALVPIERHVCGIKAGTGSSVKQTNSAVIRYFIGAEQIPLHLIQ